MNHKKTTEEFIKEAKLRHGNKYDYSLVKYYGCCVKIKIICPQHGVFTQLPSKHLWGNGCALCGMSIPKMTQIEFIKRAKDVHGDKYDYSKTIINNSRNAVIITCLIHGSFSQRPSQHLKGHGCPICGKISHKISHKSTAIDFISKARLKHGNKYDYSGVCYIHSDVNVNITCPKHGVFSITPESHINQNKICPKCRDEKPKKSTFLRSAWIKNFSDKLCILYIVLFSGYNEKFIKIGITSRTPQKRFYGEAIGYVKECLHTYTGSAEYIYDKEQDILTMFSQYKYTPKNKIRGHSECMSMDALSLIETVLDIKKKG